ncbi:hypothetical protein ACHAXM_010597 [Skeletonema potamos]
MTIVVAAAGDAEEEESSCPICLNDMCTSDQLHPIQCPTKCNFNFCINCLCHLLASSKDDYEMASDGNRHVKVRLNCPNCRADISKTIEDTIRLRQGALAEELSNVPDSELSAKNLQLKYWKKDDEILDLTDGKKKEKKGSKPMLIDKSLFGGLEFAMTLEEQKYVTKLMTSGYPDELCQASQILAGIADNIRKGRAPVMTTTPATTAHRPSNAPNRAAVEAARAAQALQSGYSNAGLSSGRSRDGDTQGATNFQREMEQQKREKLRRPLPARMPLCVTLSTGEFEKMALQHRQKSGLVDPSMTPDENGKKPGWKSYLRGIIWSSGGNASMTFVDDEWDGSVADAFARAQIGRVGKDNRRAVQGRFGPTNPVEKASIQRIIAMGLREDDARDNLTRPIRFQRVLVGSVGGQAGKVGIKKGDVVTHVNGEEFTGDAAALHALLVESYEQQGKDGVVMIVVNAEECTAEALRLRARVH